MTKVLVDKELLDRLVASAETPPEATSDAPAPPPPSTSGRPPIAWGQKVSAVFRDRVWWIADEITKKQGAPFDPNWLMACMAWESGESFSPSKKNMAGSGATGLIQFMPTTATELGQYRKTTLTTATLAKMTAEDQLTWVYWYFRMQIDRHGPITNLEDCYMAILWPSAIGKPVSAPLWDKNSKPTTYRQNAGLDVNKDGIITKREAAGKVQAKLDKGIPLAA
jgi:hypothetical protein